MVAEEGSAKNKAIRVRVAVRCRPLISKEKNEGCQICLATIGENQVLLGKDKYFTYDYAFSSNTEQEDVYQSCGYPLVEAVFKGFNSTMLAYGQTGSGKTYTMGSGKVDHSTETTSLGIIPRVVEDIFRGMDERPEFKYTTRISFLEIYNEELKDLLGNEESLSIREDRVEGIKIVGLTEKQVSSPQETLNELCSGSDNRTTGATAMNQVSSRSHAIFTLHIEQKSKTDSDDFWTAKFHLVDLAGSERAKRTGAQGERFKEGVNINLGLLALGNVISALGDEKQKRNHIPYRDSKLTRLLQDSLGGNSYTVMVACVSPADSNLEETLNTLRYADRAKKIKNKPIVNRDPQTAEILRLKSLVQELQSGVVASQCTADPVSSLEQKKVQEKYKMLEEHNRKLTDELSQAIDYSNDLCEKVILAEMGMDNLKQQLAKISVKTGLSLEQLDNSLQDPNVPSEIREKIEEFRDIKGQLDALEEAKLNLDQTLSTIAEVTEETSSATSETPSTVTSGTLTPSDTEMDREVYANAYQLHRAQMARQLHLLNTELSTKEKLYDDCRVSPEQAKENANQQTELEKQIKKLEDEKEQLKQQLDNKKTSSAASKISEQRRQRLKELETKMSELKKKLTEQNKIVKMKEQTDKQVTKLNSDILSMKQQRVKLLRQIKEESENFRKWKMAQDKELLQLKAKDRKRQCEMTKLEQKHTKTEAFYKRKTEEAALANKRLKEALEKQKVSRERNQKTAEKNISAMGPKVKHMVEDEIHMQVSITEAERHLTEQKEHRKQLTEQSDDLNRRLGFTLSNEDRTEIQLKLAEVKQQIKLCNAQISEFNQELVDAKSGKTTALHERLLNMQETRYAVRCLIGMAVSSKVTALISESKEKECNTTVDETNRKIQELEQELMEIEEYHHNEIQVMKKDFDRKSAAMKKKLEAAGGKAEDLDVKSISLDVTLLHDELMQKNEKIAELERKLENINSVSMQTPAGNRKGPLFPNLGISSSPYPQSGEYSDGEDKVKVTASHSGDTNIRLKTKTIRSDHKIEVTSRVTYLDEEEDMEADDQFVEDDDPADLSWHATPLQKRMRRQSSFSKCGCKRECRGRNCSCRKADRACGPLCGCDKLKCLNRGGKENNSPNASTASSTANTILDGTFTKGDSLNTTFSLDSSTGSKGAPKRSESTSSLFDKQEKRRKLGPKNGGKFFDEPMHSD